MLAKGHDGQEGDLRQAHKVFLKLNFYCCNGRVVIHASVERLLQKEKGSKNKEQWKLVCGAGCFPNKMSSLGQHTIISGSCQGFPSSDINFRDGLPFPAEEGSPF